MEIYTIGFTQKSAEDFFERLKRAGVRRLVDIRLNNSSQLAGFTKGRDLPYFLRQICDAAYVHIPDLAPEESTLKAYKTTGDWDRYVVDFQATLDRRAPERQLTPAYFEVPTVLLCSEPTAERCHRRLVVEHLARHWQDVRRVDL